MRRPSLLIAALGTAILIAFFAARAKDGHQLELKAYFQDVHGLRAGAPVQLAGVDIGSVTQVRVRPEMRQNPAEVQFTISTPYELKIPSDSSASLATAGLLGGTFVQIEINGTTGPPAKSGTVLKSREPEPVAPSPHS